MTYQLKECKRHDLCIDCDEKKCLLAGKLISDCPMYKCDRKGRQYENCKTCELLKQLHTERRRANETNRCRLVETGYLSRPM